MSLKISNKNVNFSISYAAIGGQCGLNSNGAVILTLGFLW
jgi:hypothetical protein